MKDFEDKINENEIIDNDNKIIEDDNDENENNENELDTSKHADTDSDTDSDDSSDDEDEKDEDEKEEDREEELEDNDFVVKIPRSDTGVDDFVYRLKKSLKEGKHPFHTVEHREFYDQEVPEQKSIFSLDVNAEKFESYLFPDSEFENIKYPKDAVEFFDKVAGNNYVANSGRLWDRFYAEVNGRKFNVFDKINDKNKDKSVSVSDLSKIYILHALTQDGVKITVVDSDGSETEIPKIQRTEQEVKDAQEKTVISQSDRNLITEYYTKYKIKSDLKTFSAPDALTDVDKYANINNLYAARDVINKDFARFMGFAKWHSPNPYKEMIIYGLPGYEDGISVADYAEIIGEKAEFESDFKLNDYRERLREYIIVHVAANPDLEIRYTPIIREYTKDGFIPVKDEKYTFYINGKKGIETYAGRELDKEIQKAKEQNKAMDDILNAIDNSDITTIHDLGINSTDSLRANYWISGRDYLVFKGEYATKENLAAAAAKFDEIFGEAVKLDDSIFDRFKINHLEESLSINELYGKIVKARDYKPASDIVENADQYKKALVLNILCNRNKLSYTKGLYNKTFKKVDESVTKRARRAKSDQNNWFKNGINSRRVYKPAINSKDRYNKRLIPEELTEQELTEAANAFEEIFKNYANNTKQSLDKVLENMEFMADADQQYENVYSYVDSVYYGENLTPETRKLYAKAFIVHALGDPREKVRLKQPLVNPTTGAVINSALDDDNYIFDKEAPIPKEYIPVEKRGVFEPKEINNEELFAKSEEQNADAKHERDKVEHRRWAFNDAKEALDLIYAVKDDTAKTISINQGEKAGKHMSAEELLGLSEEELSEAEKAFDDTFKDLMEYDAKVKSFRHNHPTTNYKDHVDLFVFGFEIGSNDLYYNIKNKVMAKSSEKVNYDDNKVDIRNKSYERYMKAFIMRAMTVKDDNVIYNPLVRESYGLNVIDRLDWRQYEYLAKYMDINHQRKADIEEAVPSVKEVEKRSGVEKWADDEENKELEDAKENTLIKGNKNVNRRPFADYDAAHNAIKENADDELDDEEWEAKEKETREAAEAKKRKEEEEKKLQDNYNLTHDIFGNELPPEDIEYNRKEKELVLQGLSPLDYMKALNQLQNERKNKRQMRLDAEKLERQKKLDEEKAEEERKWNDPVELARINAKLQELAQKEDEIKVEKEDEKEKIIQPEMEMLDAEKKIPMPPKNGPKEVLQYNTEKKPQINEENNQQNNPQINIQNNENNNENINENINVGLRDYNNLENQVPPAEENPVSEQDVAAASKLINDKLLHKLQSQKPGVVRDDRYIINMLKESAASMVGSLESASSVFYGKAQYSNLETSAKGFEAFVKTLERRFKQGQAITNDDLIGAREMLSDVSEKSLLYNQYKAADLESRGIDPSNPGRVPAKRMAASVNARNIADALYFNISSIIDARDLVANPEEETIKRIDKHISESGQPGASAERFENNLASIIYFNIVLNHMDKLKNGNTILNALYKSEVDKNVKEITESAAFRKMLQSTSREELLVAAEEENGKTLFANYVKNVAVERKNAPAGGVNNKSKEEIIAAEMDNMTTGFAADIRKIVNSIKETYGPGKADKKPSDMMKDLAGFMWKLNKQNLDKLTPEEFDNLMDVIEAKADNYLDTHKNPTKPDRIKRSSEVIKVKWAVAEYRNELRSIWAGKGGRVHSYSIGPETKGNTISQADVKKNLVAFAYEMAELNIIGRGQLPMYDPVSYDKYGQDYERPAEPSRELKDFFATMRRWYELYVPGENGAVKTYSFDTLKEILDNINKAGAIYLGKNHNPGDEIYEFVKTTKESVQDALKNVYMIEPMMDLKIDGERVGAKDIVTLAKTLDGPYKNLVAIVPEMEAVNFGEEAVNANDAVRNAVNGEQGLLQNMLTKERKMRNGLFEENSANAIRYNKQAARNISPDEMENRMVALAKIATSELMVDFTDKLGMWKNLVTSPHSRKLLIRYVKNEMSKKLLNDPLYKAVIKNSNSLNVKDNILKEAKKHNKLDELANKFGPETLLKEMKAKQAAPAQNPHM